MTWITDFEIMLKKAKSAWMDLLPIIDISNEQFTSVAQREPAFKTPRALRTNMRSLKTCVLVSRAVVTESVRGSFPLGITSLPGCSDWAG